MSVLPEECGVQRGKRIVKGKSDSVTNRSLRVDGILGGPD